MNSKRFCIAFTFCVVLEAQQGSAAGPGQATSGAPAAVQAAALPVSQAPHLAPAPASTAGTGLVAFVDLATGMLVEPSAADMATFALAPEIQNALNMSSDGLREVSLPKGGYMVKLQGRFQSTLVATIGPDGKLRMGHPIALPTTPARAIFLKTEVGDRK